MGQEVGGSCGGGVTQDMGGGGGLRGADGEANPRPPAAGAARGSEEEVGCCLLLPCGREGKLLVFLWAVKRLVAPSCFAHWWRKGEKRERRRRKRRRVTVLA